MLPSVSGPTHGMKKLVLMMIQGLASKICAQSLSTFTDSSFETLTDEILNSIQTLKSCSSRPLTPEQRDRLDAAGLSLWNWCTQEKRRQGDDESSAKNAVFTKARVLSFAILVQARQPYDNSSRAITYLERLAIKTGRYCIGM